MSIITPELSKRVGWEKINTSYPTTIEEIKNADNYQLLVWYRFLPSPVNDDQAKILNLIYNRVNLNPENN